jgi:GDP-L-fucose synthase
MAAQYGLKYLYLIPSTLYGPDYHTDDRQPHFIFDLVKKILRGSQHGEQVKLWGDGYQKRELVFVGDFVEAALKLTTTVNNEIVNVGSGEEHSIRWYAERISRLVGYNPASIIYDTLRYTGVRSKQLSIAKLKHLMPEFETTPIDSVLAMMVQWFQDTEHCSRGAASECSPAREPGDLYDPAAAAPEGRKIRGILSPLRG